MAVTDVRQSTTEDSSLTETGLFSVALMAVGCLEQLLLLGSSRAAGATRALGLMAAVCYGVCICLRYSRAWRVSQSIFAAVALLVAVVTFPETANHHYFLALLAVALWALDTGDDAAAESVRAVVLSCLVSALVWSGVQKLWWHAYDRGQFLAVAIVTDVRFRKAAALLLPSAEIERLLSLGIPRSHSGPYTLTPTMASRFLGGVPYAEIGMGLALLVPRLRRTACVAAGLFFVTVELVVHEFSFGLICILCLAMVARVSGRTRSALGLAVLGAGVLLLVLQVALRVGSIY
jgi:hypothetical protein